MKLAAFPKCYMDQLVVERSMTVFDWIEMARQLPVDGLELYYGFLESFEPAYLEKVRMAIERNHFEMPMLCCSSDFTMPKETARRKEIQKEKKMIDVTVALGGKFCRILSGQRRPEVTRKQGAQWVVDCIRECVEYGEARNITLCIENHYKDNYWVYPEFAQKQEILMEILGRIDSPHFGVQFDPSNAMLAGEDPIGLLEHIKHRVVTMHASDRLLKPGHTLDELRQLEDSVGYASILSHGVIGKGLNDFPRIFRILHNVGYKGWVSVEDGMNGLEEIRQSAEFLRPMMGSS